MSAQHSSTNQNMKVINSALLKNAQCSTHQVIALPDTDGFQKIEGVLVGKINGKWVAYDDVCDHNGGTLCLDASKLTATCPLHKWTLILNESKYENGCPKHSLTVFEENNQLTIHKTTDQFPAVDTSALSDCPIRFHFNAHASVSTSIAGLNIITDPWLTGSCFATGWWHIAPPSEEAIRRLIESDLIYISHNHPDHLHLPTLLAYADKDKHFLVPDFASGSVEKILRAHGYHNLTVAPFMQEIIVEKEGAAVKLVIVKSADERDDSSLLLFTKENSAFFGVDTNMPNKWILPDVDVLFTQFAGGASGFPSCIDNFDTAKKLEIANANRHAVLSNHVRKLVHSTNPSYVVPYAGYFTEAPRDTEVKKTNKKNSPENLIDYVKANFPDIKGINPLENPEFTLYKTDLDIHASESTPAFFVDENYIADDIAEFVAQATPYSEDFLAKLGQEFIDSHFCDDLTVTIIPCDDDFEAISEQILQIDFSTHKRHYAIRKHAGKSSQELAADIRKTSTNHVEILRIRQDSLRGAISDGLPIEDLSIGFQMRMFREPNVYNFKFWHHFTTTHLIRID